MDEKTDPSKLKKSDSHYPLQLSSSLFIHLYYCLAVLGLSCHAGAFSSFSEWGATLIVVLGLLIAMPSLAAELRL